jgi:BirA family transcriptional regulator, biotin operon repressor / biotin---[acetyl-CoA-carboxylase] ligase
VAFRRAYLGCDAEPWTIERYREVCATLGRPVRAATTSGRIISGKAIRVSPDGGLVVRDSAGEEQVIAFGEVAHLD